jgi:hypothetical protein
MTENLGKALATSLALVACATGTAFAGFSGLQLERFATVTTPAGPKTVYRLYATFTNGGDRLIFWGGNSQHITLIKSTACNNVLAGSFYNPGAGGSSAPYQEEIDASPHVQWDTFATIGVNIGDQGSGPPRSPDLTTLGLEFPNFININPLVLNAYVAISSVEDGQNRADYVADGDPPLRVLMAQLTVSPQDYPSCRIGIVGWSPEAFIPWTQTIYDLSTDLVAAYGRCCLPNGDCENTSEADCFFASGTYLGCADCSTCVPPCIGDLSADAEVNVDDLLVVINAWGQTGSQPADLSHDFVVDIDDVLILINHWGSCP